MQLFDLLEAGVFLISRASGDLLEGKMIHLICLLDNVWSKVRFSALTYGARAKEFTSHLEVNKQPKTRRGFFLYHVTVVKLIA
jgi:hypothetical protein